MPLLKTTVLRKKSNQPAKWLAVALPMAIAAGCSNGHRDVIDYTMSEAEYQAAVGTTAPAPAVETTAPTMVAALPKPQPAAIAQTTIAATEAVADAVTKTTQIPGLQNSALRKPELAEPELATAMDNKAFVDSLGFGKSIYATAGLGAARMNPDTSAVDGWIADEKVAGAGQIGIGFDLGKRLSVELHSADLGSAGLSPQGRVNYHMNGVSALFYAGKNLNRFRRRGLNAYARVGYNQLENTPIGDVPFIEQSSQHASVGLGAEYNTRIGLGVRADVVAYDGDVQFGQVGMLYRLGKKPKRSRLAAVETKAPELPELEMPEPQMAAALPAPAVKAKTPALAVAPEVNYPKMGNSTTTATLRTQQPGTQQPHVCNGLNGTLNGVQFYQGSADLTHAASTALNSTAQVLVKCPSRQIEVSAHTDNEGTALSNSLLSKIAPAP